jgi:hypothetical protein
LRTAGPGGDGDTVFSTVGSTVSIVSSVLQRLFEGLFSSEALGTCKSQTRKK